MDSEDKSQAGDEDRISRLPEGVLCHILSFISTKQVVRTSILSTMWKDIWAYVPNWTLNSQEFPSSAEFIAFVDRALLIRDSAAIQKFHLDFNGCLAEDFSTIDRWICTAVRCNVEDLDLAIETADGEEMFELPESLLTCKTLKVWKLSSNSVVKIPTLGYLPSLKSLHVNFLYPTIFNRDNNSMDISHCPVLEYLEVDGNFGPDNFSCNISASALKTLRISLGNEYIDREANNYLINAPKLEMLDVNEDSLSNYTFENTESLVEANVCISSEDYDEQDASANRATKFLAGISSVKYLTLSYQLYAGCSVAAFENLSKLTLVRGDLRFWTIVLKFLERSPNLECLVIYDRIHNPYFHRVEEEKVFVHSEKISPNLECFVFYHEHRRKKELVIELESSHRVFEDLQYWTPPALVAKGFMSSLKTISIHGFRGKKFIGYLDEMELIKYLLRHGRVLNKMAIYTTDVFLNKRYTPDFSSVTKEEFCNELALCDFGSKTVRVEFIEKMIYRG